MELLEDEKRAENLLGFSCAGSSWTRSEAIHRWTCRGFFFSFLFRHPFGFLGNIVLICYSIILDWIWIYYFYFYFLGFIFFPVGILGTFAQFWSCRKVCLSPVHNNSAKKCFGACWGRPATSLWCCRDQSCVCWFSQGPMCFKNSQGESNCGHFQEHQVQWCHAELPRYGIVPLSHKPLLFWSSYSQLGFKDST